MAWLWHAIRPWAMPLIKMRVRIRTVVGKEHIPRHGPAILASNHLSALDHVVLPIVTRRTIYNISKVEHFETPLKALFFRNVGVIPLRRGTGDKGAIDQAKKVLDRGDLFCIYPEGTRSLDGKLHKGHTGIARLALECRVPVIPVAMVGTFEAKPKGQKGITKGVETGVIVGEPMWFNEYWGKHEDRRVCRKVTDMIMHRIAELSGQEYVDEYQYNPEVPGYHRPKEQDLEHAP